MTANPTPETYTILRATAPFGDNGQWEGAAWGSVPPLDVTRFHPRTGDHRPRTQAKLLYEAHALHLIFRVEDRYVRSVRTRPQEWTCMDSCVEFFVEPTADRGYFNFEVNAGGTILLHYHERPERRKPGEPNSVPVAPQWIAKMPIYHSLPPVVEPERTDPTTWLIEYAIPWKLFEASVGSLGPLPGQTWRANFYKCAEESSHPHWATWSPIGEKLDFHQPKYFGTLRLE
jgi:hypothetical protein